MIRKYCCKVVEYSLKVQYLGDCRSSILLMKNFITCENISNSFYDAYGIWQNCVRLLVMHTCKYGLLDWLGVGMLKSDVDIEKAIVDSFYLLAKSTSFQHNSNNNSISEQSTPCNYYECLQVYMLSKSDFNEAARVSYMSCNRINDVDSFATSRHHIIELFTLSMCAHLVTTSQTLNYVITSNPDLQLQHLKLENSVCLLTPHELGSRILEMYFKFQIMMTNRTDLHDNADKLLEILFCSELMSSVVNIILRKRSCDILPVLDSVINIRSQFEMLREVLFSPSSEPFPNPINNFIHEIFFDIFCRFGDSLGRHETSYKQLLQIFHSTKDFSDSYGSGCCQSYLKWNDFKDFSPESIAGHFQNILLQK